MKSKKKAPSAILSEPKTMGELRIILGELRSGLERLYAERLRGLYLFGSYARGEARADSDLDVIIVLDEVPVPGEEIDRTGDLASRLSLEYDVSLSRSFVSETEWRAADIPFIRVVRKEVIPA